jgi:hypothetical protein
VTTARGVSYTADAHARLSKPGMVLLRALAGKGNSGGDLHRTAGPSLRRVRGGGGHPAAQPPSPVARIRQAHYQKADPSNFISLVSGFLRSSSVFPSGRALRDGAGRFVEGLEGNEHDNPRQKPASKHVQHGSFVCKDPLY